MSMTSGEKITPQSSKVSVGLAQQHSGAAPKEKDKRLRRVLTVTFGTHSMSD
jgi:hypothetical protein